MTSDFYGILSLVLFLIGSLAFLGLMLWLAKWLTDRRVMQNSPYSALPTRRSHELSYATIGKIALYLQSLHQFDNRMFNIHRVAVCLETGRVFPNAINSFGKMHLDWTFLQKRYPGHWVSWGSLSYRQQQAIRDAHHTLAGYQTEKSSPEPSPRLVSREYAMTHPGPLYVDLETMVLLGWKRVPGTDLEVLIVQKPKRIQYRNRNTDNNPSKTSS